MPEAFPQRADEHAGAADLGQVHLGDVAERGERDKLDPGTGARGDEPRDMTGLGHRHRAPAGTEPQYARRHLASSGGMAGGGPPATSPASALVTASTASGSRSKSTRRAAS